MSDPTDVPDTRSSTDSEEEDPGWPLSFILLVVAGGLYLVLRFFQMAQDVLT